MNSHFNSTMLRERVADMARVAEQHRQARAGRSPRPRRFLLLTVRRSIVGAPSQHSASKP